MKVLKAKQKHLGDILQINQQLFLNIPNFKWNKSDWIKSQINNKDYYVLMGDGLVCGALCLKMSAKESYIAALAIKENQHLSGFGKKLVDFARSISKKQGKSILSVESFCKYNAKDFYLKCGFKLGGGLGDYGGQNYYKFFMDLK